jgi:hypothetical protein
MGLQIGLAKKGEHRTVNPGEIVLKNWGQNWQLI